MKPDIHFRILGLKGFFQWLEKNTYKTHVRVFLSRYRAYNECPDCCGSRLAPDSICWKWQGKTVMATPNLNEGVVSIIDMVTWQTIKQIKTPGPGFFMRSHENSRYAWVDSMMSKEGKDTLTVIDKETLEVAAQLRPEPGKTLAHIEFTRDGRYALASLWESNGALIIYDARSLKEVKRLPMSKPIGKYNLWNKITRSEGTSH
jgi:hypothetical protein